MAAADLEVVLLAGQFQVRGTCTYTLRLAHRLPEYGIGVQIVCPDARLVDAQKRKQFRMRESPYLDSRFWWRFALKFMLRDLDPKTPPRLIHIQSRRMLKQGTALARQLNCPFVLTMHDYLRPRERLYIDRRLCAGIIAVSESVKNDLAARTGVPESLITVIRSGVEVCGPVKVTTPLDPGHVPVIGTAGPLEAVKGLPFFLSAAQQVLADGREVEFLVAGAGPEEANLRRLARELGIAHKVTFVPYLLDFAESLAAMDIFCLSSLQQGLGTVMLEAMALGRPVIATGVGGVYSVVRDGQTGLMIPPSNSGELARRMRELLDDPVRARAIGEAARQFVTEEFSVERMVAQTAELYRHLLSSSAPPVMQPAAT
jgi:glycosyltransferase involved in cell wall biosynthesis